MSRQGARQLTGLVVPLTVLSLDSKLREKNLILTRGEERQTTISDILFFTLNKIYKLNGERAHGYGAVSGVGRRAK